MIYKQFFSVSGATCHTFYYSMYSTSLVMKLNQRQLNVSRGKSLKVIEVLAKSECMSCIIWNLKNRISTMENKKLMNNESVEISNIKAEKDQPDKLFYKTSYCEEQFQIVQVKQPRKSINSRRSSVTN